MPLKIILTGATGFVGEGVLLECLAHPDVAEALSISRKPCGIQHEKLKECIVTDFMQLEAVEGRLTGYDACFYCAGISSVGVKEPEYSHITYDIPVHFAETLLRLNPQMVFCHISGAATNENSRVMWARVKGRAESTLMKMPFKAVYNFRPAYMKPLPEQKNIKSLYRFMGYLYPLLKVLVPGSAGTMKQVGQAMINSVLKGYPRQILEVKDIKELGGEF